MTSDENDLLANMERRVWSDKSVRLQLAKALFDKEEALLPEGDLWEEADQAHYDACAMAVVDALMNALRGALQSLTSSL